MAVLVERHDVVGGENLITVPSAATKAPESVSSEEIIERFTLTRPWEGWIVDDQRVAHYVSSVEVRDGCDVGTRTVMLIDFTPLTPTLLD
jgi:hypothetical protein